MEKQNIYSFQVHLDPSIPLECEIIRVIESFKRNKITKKQILMDSIQALEDEKDFKDVLGEISEIKDILKNANFKTENEYTNDTFKIKIDDMDDAEI